MSLFDTARLEKELKKINKLTEEEGFWEDHERAQVLLREKKRLETKLGEYNALCNNLSDIEMLMAMSEEEEDDSLVSEIQKSFDSFKEDLEKIVLATLLTGEYDAGNAIIGIYAGTGGVDAMDWADMLGRMYMRWAEKKGYRVKVIDRQASQQEAGIKNMTMLIEGENAYGYLKNERGVHRLVRISPFNTQGKRQTSFASLEVMPEIDEEIDIEINNEDLKVDTYRAGGAGGQHVNKTDSAVRITHLPTNIVVTCQNERSQHQNREVAMKILKSKLVELAELEKKANIKELKGDFSMVTWGSQIRSYVFQPYTMVKDHRTGAEVGNVTAVMDGDIDYFITEKLKAK